MPGWLLHCARLCLLLVSVGRVAGVLEFHPRLLGLDSIDAPFHLQLPPHMLSTSHKRKSAPDTVDEATFLSEAKSQFQEDITFYQRYLPNNTDSHKFYLELGALDGKDISNTWALEHTLGWTGILIEPGPVNFASLSKNRPNNILINAAICDKPQVVHFAERLGVGGIVEFMAPDFLKKWWPDLNRTAESLSTVPQTVCIPLSSILSAFNVRHIDYLIVDVEGGELQVLQTIDFSEVYVYLAIVEADHTNPEKELAIQNLFREKGFEYTGYFNYNDYFVNTRKDPRGLAAAAGAGRRMGL